MVSQQWRVDWDSFLSSSKGYVFIYLDVRGSGYQGDSHRKVVHRRLSKAEVDDALYVIRYNDKYLLTYQKHLQIPENP